MVLTLDHAQRINLKQLVSNLPSSLENIRSYWALMDRLNLSSEEKLAIDYFEQVGPPPVLQRLPAWNPEKSLPKVEFELTEFEVQTVKAAMAGTMVLVGPSRAWLEDLLDQLQLTRVI